MFKLNKKIEDKTQNEHKEENIPSKFEEVIDSVAKEDEI